MADTPQQEVHLGFVSHTDRGEWVKGYVFTQTNDDGSTTKFTGYAINDVVEHNNCVYSSLVTDNTTEPGTDATKWRLWVDGSKVKQSVTDANSAATAATNAATNANDTGDHPTYVGEDNYVYKWNKTSKTYDKTDIFVKGDKGEKGDKGDTGATGGALWPHFKKVNNHLYAVDNGSNLAQRIKRVNNHIVAIL